MSAPAYYTCILCDTIEKRNHPLNPIYRSTFKCYQCLNPGTTITIPPPKDNNDQVLSLTKQNQQLMDQLRQKDEELKQERARSALLKNINKRLLLGHCDDIW